MVAEPLPDGRDGRGWACGGAARLQHRRPALRRRRIAAGELRHRRHRRGGNPKAQTLGRRLAQAVPAAAPRPTPVGDAGGTQARNAGHLRERRPGVHVRPDHGRAHRLRAPDVVHAPLFRLHHLPWPGEGDLLAYFHGRRPRAVERGVLVPGERSVEGRKDAPLHAVGDLYPAGTAAHAATGERLLVPVARAGHGRHHRRRRLRRHRRPRPAQRTRLPLGDVDGGQRHRGDGGAGSRVAARCAFHRPGE